MVKVRIVGMRARAPAPEAINNQWRDRTSYDWLNKVYSCYMATLTVLVIVNGRGLGIGMRRRHLPTKS